MVKILRARLKLLSAFVDSDTLINKIDKKLYDLNKSLSYLRDCTLACETLLDLIKKHPDRKLFLAASELSAYFQREAQDEKNQISEVAQHINSILVDLSQINHIKLKKQGLKCLPV